MEHQPSRNRGTVIVSLHEAMPALVALEIEGAVTETCPDMAGEQLDGADHQSGLAAYVSGLGGARQDIMLVLQEGGERTLVLEIGHRAEIPAQELHGADLEAVRPLRHRGVGGVEGDEEGERQGVEAGFSCGDFLLMFLSFLGSEQGPQGDFGGIGSRSLGGFRRLFRLRSCVSDGRLEVPVHRQTESGKGVLASLIQILAGGDAALGVAAVGAATAGHACDAVLAAGGVLLGLLAVYTIQILAPFPHIAAHIVQTEGVGLFGAHSAWGAAAVVVVPADDGESVAAAVQERRVAEVLATAGGVFPFRLGGQTVVHSGLLVEPEEENLHLVPGNILHGQVIAHHAARVGAHNLLPQLLGDFIFGDGETL